MLYAEAELQTHMHTHMFCWAVPACLLACFVWCARFWLLADSPVCACFGLQEGEPTNIVDEVIRSRKRRRKASDEQIESEVMSLVLQVSTGATPNLNLVSTAG